MILRITDEKVRVRTETVPCVSYEKGYPDKDVPPVYRVIVGPQERCFDFDDEHTAALLKLAIDETCDVDRAAMTAEIAALKNRVDVRCDGCGSGWTNEELEQERPLNSKLLSCCPERKPLNIDQWRVRSYAAEAALAKAREDALEEAAKIAEDYRLAEKHFREMMVDCNETRVYSTVSQSIAKNIRGAK